MLGKWSGIFLMLALATLMAGCGQDKGLPDVSGQSVESRWIRFDRALFEVEHQEDIDTLYQRYPAFAPLFFHEILGLPTVDGKVSIDEVDKMLKAETFKMIKRASEGYFEETADLEQEWAQAMKYYQHHFGTDAPDVYCTVTEFGYASFLFADEKGRDALGISLDMFLGDSMDYQPMARVDPLFSSYNSRSFDRRHLVRRAVEALLMDKMPAVRSRKFIDHFIQEGKKMYALKQLLPHAPDSVIWESTAAQTDWVMENEWNLYGHIISEQLMYSDDFGRYTRLLQPAPSSAGLPAQAPGRALTYSAYKIVEAYMNRHPECPLDELLSRTDATYLLQEAKYRPKPD